MKVIHSIVKEKRPFNSDDGQDDDLAGGTGPRFNSMDHEISLKVNNAPLQKAMAPSEEVSEYNQMKSPFGLQSEV